MHNGQIAGFEKIRRPMEAALSDRLYQARHGTTDSELLFLLALEFGLEEDPAAAFGQAIRFALSEAARAGVRELVRFTAAFSDGDALHAIRYASDDYAPTLYSAPTCNNQGHCLVSEPFKDTDTKWHEIPAGSIVTLKGSGMSSKRFEPMQAAVVKVAEVA